MKIHNPNDLEFDSRTLRSLARGDLDPVRQAVEDHHRGDKKALTEGRARGRAVSPNEKLPVGLAKSTGELARIQSARVEDGHNRTGRGSGKRGQGAEHNTAENSIESPEVRHAKHQALVRKRNQLTDVIRECEALEVMNYDVLAAKHYPDSEALLAARRRRDLWLMCCLFCSGMVIVGWVGLLSAWIAGSAFGALVLLLALMLKPFRALIYQLPSHRDLKLKQKLMEFKALNHIKMLEGRNGLAWQCQRMRAYRAVLGEKRFQRLILLSKQGNLIKAMRTVAGIRLYLIYLLEAQQAFSVAKQEYMKTSILLKREYADLTLEHSQ